MLNIRKLTDYLAFIAVITYICVGLLFLFPFKTPDLGSYLLELKDFDYASFRIDYASWAVLKFSGGETQNQLRFLVYLAFIGLLIITIRNTEKMRILMYSLLPVFPMILASQLRLGFAIIAFLIIVTVSKKWFFAMLASSFFHSSFALIFALPFLAFATEFTNIFEYIPGLNGKLLAYSKSSDGIVIAPDLVLMASCLFVFFVRLKSYAQSAWIFVIFLSCTLGVQLENWEARRRLIELLFVVFNPFLRMYILNITLNQFLSIGKINKYILFSYICGISFLAYLNFINFIPKIK